MTLAGWIIAGMAALLAAAIGLEVSLKRGRRRPLSSVRPEKPARKAELGQEATDVELVRQTHARNEKIERANWRWSRKHK